MEGSLKRLSAGAEFAIVMALVFGLFIYISLHAYFFGHWGVHSSDAGKLHLVATEIVLFALAAGFLWTRGWTLERIGLKITATDTLIGIGFGIGLHVISRGLTYALWYGGPILRRIVYVPHADAPQMSLGVIVAVLVVNSIYEEVFASGYLLSFLKERFGSAVAINAGLFLRVLYHLYQGVGALLHVVPMALLFGLWYVRTRRLWPLIVAHATINLWSYAHYIRW